MLPEHKNTQLRGVVKGRKQEWDGKLCGKSNENLILDTCVYNVPFPNVTKKEYYSNAIANSTCPQYDIGVNDYILLDLISDHKKTSDAMEEQGA